VLLIHGAAFVILAGFVLLLLDPTQLQIGRYVSAKAYEVKEVMLWTTMVMFFLSYCFSVSVLLLESRKQRPLLTTMQWLLLAVLLLPTMFSLFGLRFLFLTNRMVISFARNSEASVYLLLPLIPVMGLLAVYLSVVYHRRVTQLTSWRE